MSTTLDSKRLITSIKRRGMIPSSQETFTDVDFLEIASEEINLNLMGEIIRAHEEHLVYEIDIPLVKDQFSYPIPSRAHGNKLRDASLVFNAGTPQEAVYELHRMSLEEASDFRGPYSYTKVNSFYLKNNEVWLVTGTSSDSYSLRMSFYLRPNSLVVNNRGCSVVTSTASTEIDNINPVMLSATAISTGTTSVDITIPNHNLTVPKISILGSNSTPSIDGFYTYSSVDTNTIRINVGTPVTVAGNAANVQAALDVTVFSLDFVPKHFSTSFLFDFVQNVSPNKIITYDIHANNLDNTLGTISFPADSVTKVIRGTYITVAEETIVPNIPTELHPILAQAVAVHCMEALGDEQGKVSAERKLDKMKTDAFALLDNRVEGAPLKIRNRYSPLNQALTAGYRRYNRR